MHVRMKSLVRIVTLAICLLACSQAFAQYIPDWKEGDLARKRTMIVVGDQVLDREASAAFVAQAGGPRLASEWDKAVSKRKLGLGLTIGGFSVSALGSTLAAGGAMAGGLIGAVVGGIAGGDEGAQEGFRAGAWNPLTIWSLVAAGVGVATGVVGVVQLKSANDSLNGIVDQCNGKGPSVSLSVGSTPNGIGLALNF